MSDNKTIFFVLALTVLFIIIYSFKQKNSLLSPQSTQLPSSAPVVLGQQTKTNNCVANNSLPDKACTPGAVFPTVTKEQICTPGYSKSVRNVPSSIKEQVFASYGITSHRPGEYEVDHLISLELGGSNDISNLWPEVAEPRPGYHEKDKVENYLHDEICSGSITLQEAQQKIASDWLQVYNEMGE